MCSCCGKPYVANGERYTTVVEIGVSDDAVYFHIDPSRNAEVAMMLFGSVQGTVFLVCDRYSAYQSEFQAAHARLSAAAA